MSRFKRIIFIIIKRAYSVPALSRANPPVDLNTKDTVRALVFGWLCEGLCLSVFLDLAMLLRADSSKTWTEMGKGRDPQPLSHRLQARHISPTETGFLRSLTCSQLHFVRHAFLTLPRENSGRWRSRLRQTTHPCWRSAGPVKAQSWRLGRLGSLHSPTQTGILFQESRKWCYCELVLTLCHSEFSVLK